jgi:hypothetical protein
MVDLRQQGNAGLDAVEQLPTLRDRIVTLPVDSAIPNHWEVGCKVVKFKGELPADAITLKRQRRAQELILTTAGTEGRFTLGIYEHDRTRGQRRQVGVKEHDRQKHIKQTLYEAFTDTCRQAARIDGLPPSVAAIEVREAPVVVKGDTLECGADDVLTENEKRILAQKEDRLLPPDSLLARLLGKIKVY